MPPVGLLTAPARAAVSAIRPTASTVIATSGTAPTPNPQATRRTPVATTGLLPSNAVATRPKAAELAPGGLVVVDTPSAVVQVEPYVESEASSVMGGYAASSSNYECAKDHNSVTIKADTSVKDAAGAIVKVLNRLSSTFVTALRLEPSHQALNQAVKALAVSRKYVRDAAESEARAAAEAAAAEAASGDVSDEQRAEAAAAAAAVGALAASTELSFMPLNRTNADGQEDPNLFAFLSFKALLAPGVALKEYDETDLNVSRGSDPNAMANAIIRIVKERGQAVMKAGGGSALFVAMTAVVNARRRLKRNHNMDVMLVPQWITEDTRAALGRESKFLRFNILPCGMNGVGPGAMAAIYPLPHEAGTGASSSSAASVASMALA